jgi:hypothetical protein
MVVTLERARELGSQVMVGRADGSGVSVRLRLLGYDSCEFESACRFTVGEQISIHLYRMGSIRARITSRHAKVVEAEFVKDCPV